MSSTDYTRLRRHVLLNGLGWLFPAALALAAVPALARLLGPERFGLVSLAWAAVSAFAILDVGLGRALSLSVADRRARNLEAEIPGLVRAAGVWSWGLFAPLGALGVLLSPWIVARYLDVSPSLADEAVRTLRWLSLSLPFVVHGIVLRAAFEGEQRFGLINALRIPLGVVTWGGPWLTALFTRDVSALAAVIVGGRGVYWLAQWWWLTRTSVESAAPRHAVRSAVPARSAHRALWATGSWITLSGALTPLLTAVDRLVVALVAPIAVVGWYVAAGEGATKLWLFPAALGPVLAPALAAAYARDDRGGAVILLRKALHATGLVLLVPAVLLIFAADPVLRWWLADSFAPAVVPVFQGFVAAVFANSLAHVGYAGLQAGGSARAAAILHLVELPVYLLALWWGAHHYGVVGAAVAWGGRLIVDAGLMTALAVRYVALPRRDALLWCGVALALLAPLLLGATVRPL